MKKIDLHNTYHSEVPKRIDEFISLYYKEKSLIIVTGNSEVMKKIVIDLITEYGYQYEIGDFLGINNGFIKIY